MTSKQLPRYFLGTITLPGLYCLSKGLQFARYPALVSHSKIAPSREVPERLHGK
jgi:hypothetical protein